MTKQSFELSGALSVDDVPDDVSRSAMATHRLLENAVEIGGSVVTITTPCVAHAPTTSSGSARSETFT
jgi:hypothetical protein